MSSDQTPAQDLPDDATKEQIQDDIEATRERLAASVEELAAKADIKAQVSAAARETKDNVQAKAHQTQQHVSSTTDNLLSAYRRLPLPAQVALIAAPAALLVFLIIRSRRH